MKNKIKMSDFQKFNDEIQANPNLPEQNKMVNPAFNDNNPYNNNNNYNNNMPGYQYPHDVHFDYQPYQNNNTNYQYPQPEPVKNPNQTYQYNNNQVTNKNSNSNKKDDCCATIMCIGTCCICLQDLMQCCVCLVKCCEILK